MFVSTISKKKSHVLFMVYTYLIKPYKGYKGFSFKKKKLYFLYVPFVVFLLHFKGLKLKMTKGKITFIGIKSLFPYILCIAHSFICSCSDSFPPCILWLRKVVHSHGSEVKTGERRAWKTKATSIVIVMLQKLIGKSLEYLKCCSYQLHN